AGLLRRTSPPPRHRMHGDASTALCYPEASSSDMSRSVPAARYREEIEVLTEEQNTLLTQVDAGTPAGELLRRYWHPIAIAQELMDEQPTRFVRVLGEDLVLFKDKSGNVGLIQDHCAHRCASLVYGRVEERGIACAYHGWLYDTSGSCLECPAEPAGSMFHLTVHMRAYPVQRFAGFYWAYMGPLPA